MDSISCCLQKWHVGSWMQLGARRLFRTSILSRIRRPRLSGEYKRLAATPELPRGHKEEIRLAVHVAARSAHPVTQETAKQKARQTFEFEVQADHAGATKAGQRLDAFLATFLPDASRVKAQTSIKAGLVTVNGKQVVKSSQKVKLGDQICCTLPPPQTSRAEPEDLPLEILYEDDDVLVINKAAGMVVHPSPGHYSGTLVNALLHHLHLPCVEVSCGNPPTGLHPPESGHLDEVEQSVATLTVLQYSEANGGKPVIRPGIVHRLDKGTTGLMVLAKNDMSHRHLCQQFHDRTVERTYVAVNIGVPAPAEGLIQTNIDRSPSDKLKMVAYAPESQRGKLAVSTYRVLEDLGGKAAILQWKLKTGRTHQIRVHAKHIGHPLLADDAYSGGAASAMSRIGGGAISRRRIVEHITTRLGRPALHAKTLGFMHPQTNVSMQFTSHLPQDMLDTVAELKTLLQN